MFLGIKKVHKKRIFMVRKLAALAFIILLAIVPAWAPATSEVPAQEWALAPDVAQPAEPSQAPAGKAAQEPVWVTVPEPTIAPAPETPIAGAPTPGAPLKWVIGEPAPTEKEPDWLFAEPETSAPTTAEAGPAAEKKIEAPAQKAIKQAPAAKETTTEEAEEPKDATKLKDVLIKLDTAVKELQAKYSPSDAAARHPGVAVRGARVLGDV